VTNSHLIELTANVDVYNEWIDCCEAENQAAEREGEGDEGDLDNFVI
jgi:transcription elongation factor Elf1